MKKDIIDRNDKDQPHGLWLVYDWDNDNLIYKGHWVNGVNYGYWIRNVTIFQPKYSINFYLR